MEKQILKTLKKIIDPELGINIVDLGLIINIQVKEDNAIILMTLTSPACPYGETLIASVKEKTKALNCIKGVKVKLTFTPPWNENNISKAARIQLGL